ncbi:MAG: DUF899 domain-containing protein [Actinomycetia bacterium]|nr:DUF899 domain-containing protein [Actinomycetes bacterium]MCP4226578.1 DUF899 domain-containing protein [Actinomycetes bacterium]MCP5033807.1 DUF899 domain-containing protein [Actinomycetes bacterium]
MSNSVEEHDVVGRGAWLAAQQEHLALEKAFTHEREAMAASRRDLPWLEITESYVFDTPDGEQTLVDLFDDKSQLIVYHFMFGPDWGDEGCPVCSFWADNYDGSPVHLAARDTAFAAISRASLDQIATYQKRMGWGFRWVSSGRSTFNYDLGASATPEQIESGAKTYNFETSAPMGPESAGVSVFARDGDRVFLTYQVSSRGLDLFNGTYHLLDLTPKGRDEANLPWAMAWLQRHDAYPTAD